MSDDTATKDGFTFNLEDAGPARKRLTVAISADAVQARIDASMGTLQGQSSLPGFRKGKAPKHLLERRFGKALREETQQELMQEGCRLGFEAHSLNPLGDLEPADPDADIRLEAGKPLEFAVEFEVIPDFDMPDFSTLEVIRPHLEVEDAQIDEELSRQCMRAGDSKELDGDFTSADRMLGKVDLYLEDGEEPIFSHEQILAVVPEKGESGQLLGLIIDDLAKQLQAASVGDTVTFKTTGPEGHEREDIRGKSLKLEYTIHIAERITPCTPEALMERFSLASEDVLREQIRLALEQQRDAQQASAMRDQAIKAAADAIDMELPERLSERQVASDLERIRMELMQRGMEADEIEVKLAEVRDRSADQTRDNLKRWFLLERVAADEDIQVSEQEINGRIATMAMQQQVRPDVLRADLVKADRIMALARSIRETKAADHMVSLTSVTDMPVEEWNKRVEKEKAAAAS
ncbi:MAG: trigger factor [Phycisphaerales bacterium]|jgi:trigger factor|nr:trigger factor [Phycisphaerales bacterium]